MIKCYVLSYIGRNAVSVWQHFIDNTTTAKEAEENFGIGQYVCYVKRKATIIFQNVYGLNGSIPLVYITLTILYNSLTKH